MLTDEQLLQFSRQIMLPQIDLDGQQQLLDARVLLIGLGGLGSPVALYLAAAGVGHLTLVDDDQVELSNLQRQVIHQFNAIGMPKVESAKTSIRQINPQCEVSSIAERLDEKKLNQMLVNFDVVVDCCDNFATRFMLNRACFLATKPLVSAAAIRWEGQLTTFTMQTGTPCYRCLYEDDVHTDQTCVQNGVVAPLVGILGSMQALETIKLICKAGEVLSGRLMLFDGLDMNWRTIIFKPRPDCPVCAR